MNSNRLVAALMIAVVLGAGSLVAGCCNCGQKDGAAAPAPTTSSDDKFAHVPRVALKDVQQQMLDRGVVVVDARGRIAFGKGHVPGATNVPVMDYTPETKLPKDAALIVLYCDCEAEMSAADVCDQMMKAGYTNAKVLAGGWNAWVGAKLPVEQ